jgi:hypothetical protein
LGCNGRDNVDSNCDDQDHSNPDRNDPEESTLEGQIISKEETGLSNGPINGNKLLEHEGEKVSLKVRLISIIHLFFY